MNSTGEYSVQLFVPLSEVVMNNVFLKAIYLHQTGTSHLSCHGQQSNCPTSEIACHMRHAINRIDQSYTEMDTFIYIISTYPYFQHT